MERKARTIKREVKNISPEKKMGKGKRKGADLEDKFSSHNMRYEFYEKPLGKLTKETEDALDYFILDGEPYNSLD